MCRAAILCLLLVSSCNAPHPQIKSLCDLPSSLQTEEHATIRFRGAMMGGFNHGFTLIADACPKRRIRVNGWPEDVALRSALWEHSAELGVMQVDVSGRVTGDRKLDISKVHQFKFEPMTESQMAVWWGRTR